MNRLSHAVRKFNRFELKYLIPIKQAEKVKHAISDYLDLDEHGNKNGKYRLTSLYYDSPDYRCYYEKIDGIKFRRKLRIRFYGSTEEINQETPVFVEIKQRLDKVTQKRRAVLEYSEALRLCNQRETPNFAPIDKAVIDEITAFIWQYNLQPSSIVRYERQAYIGREYDVGLRVTFDTNITGQSCHLLLHDQSSCVLLFPADFTVMEIKVNERIPYWLTDLVAGQNLNLVRVSKYCRSVEISNQNLVPSTIMPIDNN